MEGSRIISEAWGDKLLIFLYDESGAPIGMQYRNTTYAANRFDTFYFEKNLQGDVVAVYNSSGIKVISYTYDAWGNHTVKWHDSYSTNFNASYNPFRYRGYYYDTDTGLYYLQSRYYNPQWGRFLNADGYVSTGQGLLGYNMYAYCNNNPVMGYDPKGEYTFSLSASVPISLFAGGYSVSLSFAADSEGMNALQFSYSVPNDKNTRNTAIGLGIGIGASFQYTNYDSVDQLNGAFKYAGLNTPVIGGNAVLSEDNEIVGVEGSVGPFAGADVHVNETYTYTWLKWKSVSKWLNDMIGW